MGRAGTAGGVDINRGLSFVIVKLKLAGTVKTESDITTDIVYVPTSLNPADIALIVNGLGFVNNPPDIGIVCTVPPIS